jgi:DNA polymerase/3'-5' exonuclease PolX
MIEKLCEIHGIGEVWAQEILDSVDDLDPSMSIDEIYEKIRKHRMFDELPVAAKVDIIMRPVRIKWDQIDKVNSALRKKIKGIKWLIAGGYIRKKKESGDIDIVLSTGRRSSRQEVWFEFREAANKISGIYFHEPYAMGDYKVSTIVELGGVGNVRVDIFLPTPDEWVCAVLYATGSGQFNMRMRAQAKRLGYKLNQRHLYKGKEAIDTTERQIFRLLKMRYVKPEDRTV